jgi:hypothetical protein
VTSIYSAILPILIIIIVALTYFFGWIVLAISAGFLVCIPVVTAIYDKITHDSNCTECNIIKQVLFDELGIDIAAIKTKHEKVFDDHMYIRADIGEEKTILFDIRICGGNLRVVQGESFLAEKIREYNYKQGKDVSEAALHELIGRYEKDVFNHFDPQIDKLTGIEPIKTIEEAMQCIESFEGGPEEFKLHVSDQLQDPVGMNMAIITDSILKRDWMPDGFEQREGYRIYQYTKTQGSDLNSSQI